MDEIRKHFPILNIQNRGKKLVYLDNAATSLTPNSVLDSINEHYTTYRASVHRSVFELGEIVTNKYEESRNNIAQYIGAKPNSIIFTKNATESLNLVADAWGYENLKKNDTILLTNMEHHSNIIPWQVIAKKTGAILRYIFFDKNGELNLNEIENELKKGVKILSVTHASNVLGTINPIKEICALAHQYNTLVCVDGCQSTPHLKIDVSDLDCDFFAFSGHKMLGPTGIGALYAKEEILNQMSPYQTGGGMINDVGLYESEWTEIPHKFEPGSPMTAQVIGLSSAVNFLHEIDWESNHGIAEYVINKLREINGIEIYGQPKERTPIVSFNIQNIHSLDLAHLLDYEGITIRSGHMCCKPLMDTLKISGCARASFYFYNTFEEADIFVEKLKKSINILL